MPSLFGGGNSVPAPTVNANPGVGTAQVYTPQNQPGADTSYMNLLNSLIGEYTAGNTPPQQLNPYANALGIGAFNYANSPSIGGAVGNIVNNPYFNSSIDY